MYYKIYKDIRNAAWQCLLDFEIDTLPVDVLKIAKVAGIRVIKNSVVKILKDEEKARTFYDNDTWLIVYDDTLSIPCARLSIAHELGHIFLGHDICYAEYFSVRVFKKETVSEKQADSFAIKLLTPACVIWGLGLDSAEDIADHCRVPLPAAKKRMARMTTLYKRNKFLSTASETAVYANFRKYIKNENNSKDVKI